MNIRKNSLGILFGLVTSALFLLSAGAFGENQLTIGSGAGGVGTTGNLVSVYLTNDQEVAGLQFTLTDKLSFLTVDSVLLSQRSQNFIAMTHGNQVILFSLTGKTIPASDGKIFDIQIRVAESAAASNDTLEFQTEPLLATAAGERIAEVLTDAGIFSITPVSDVSADFSQQPTSYGLGQNYPNPFNPETVIRFAVKESGRLLLEVYDVTGRKVTTLHSGTAKVGQHQVIFKGEDLPSGIYFYRLSINDFAATRKMLLVR